EREGRKGRHVGQIVKGAAQAIYTGRGCRNAQDAHAVWIGDALVLCSDSAKISIGPWPRGRECLEKWYLVVLEKGEGQARRDKGKGRSGERRGGKEGRS